RGGRRHAPAGRRSVKVSVILSGAPEPGEGENLPAQLEPHAAAGSVALDLEAPGCQRTEQAGQRQLAVGLARNAEYLQRPAHTVLQQVPSTAVEGPRRPLVLLILPNPNERAARSPATHLAKDLREDLQRGQVLARQPLGRSQELLEAPVAALTK